MTDEPDPDLGTTRRTPAGQDPEVVAGRYRILRTLGRGGGGIVWLAQDEHLGREVALKRVSGEADPEVLVTRGLREARTSATLAHDHVVRVYDAFVTDGAPWIVMEYVPGPSLAGLLEGGATLPVNQVATIGAQMATALAAAHGAGILHRDVKPANVLLTDASGTHAKLTDFGIARAEEDHQLTRTGMVSGTAAYFSPEVASGEDPSPASDVWALGATLYAAVEGRRPYPDAGNAVAQLHAIVRDQPRAPRQAGALTPVLAGMLAPDPARRWSADQAAQALRGVASGGPPADRAGQGAGATAAAAGAALGSAPWGTDAPPTQAHRPVDSTREVPVVGPAHAPAERQAAPPARAAVPAASPTRPPRRRRSGGRTLGAWLLGVPLAALLAWLVWSLASTLDGPGSVDDPGASTSAPADTAPLSAEEAGQVARSFYLVLATDGLEAARAMLGPDVPVDPGIADGLTRVEYDKVTTAPAADGSVAVGITVRYFYGETVYEQREDLVLSRAEPGAAPIIVSRSTSEPVVTGPGHDD
ncbi:serine/threonine-protein kinase [Ornithinimicrobium sp. LYQ103]|uniref:serine/threonine-protein kinase n=1 Tax=Ornithinimicrobium sp. LYQ103 TaxID=3378796 RepID=UPI00385560DB